MQPSRTRAAALMAVLAVTAGACGGDGAPQPVVKREVVTTTTQAEPSASSTTAAATRATTTRVTQKSTRTTKVAAPLPFRIPKLGAYNYHERLQPGSGEPTERAVRYQLSAVTGRAGAVRWDEADPQSGAVREKGDHYEEMHDPDGLYLLASIVLGKDDCRWSPRSALLPKAVIDGGTAQTRSTCTVPIEGKPTELTLETTLKFVRKYDFRVAGAARPSIDVARVRVLTGNTGGSAFTITSDAVDTFAFDLGVRVRTQDHSTTKATDSQGQERTQESTRTLTLTGTP